MIGQFNEPYSTVRPAKFKSLFQSLCKMSLEENFEANLKEKYANQEKEQNIEIDNPNFRVSFLNCPHV